MNNKHLYVYSVFLFVLLHKRTCKYSTYM